MIVIGADIHGKVEVKQHSSWYSIADVGMVIPRNYSLFGYLFGVRKDFPDVPDKFHERGLPENPSFSVESELAEIGVVRRIVKVKALKEIEEVEYTEKSPMGFGNVENNENQKSRGFEKGQKYEVPKQLYHQMPRDSKEKLGGRFELNEIVDAHSITYFYLDEMIEFLKERQGKGDPVNELVAEFDDGNLHYRNAHLTRSLEDEIEEHFEIKKLEDIVKANEKFDLDRFNINDLVDASEFKEDPMVSIRETNIEDDILGQRFQDLIGIMKTLDKNYDNVRAVIWFDN